MPDEHWEPYGIETQEAKRRLKKLGANVESIFNEWEFYSPELTVGGVAPKRTGKGNCDITWHGLRVTMSASEHKKRIYAKHTRRIPGLRCPYCNSQAWETDHPGIAMCGAAPGWYFFYRTKSKSAAPKSRIALVNGEYQIVEDSEAEVGKT